jgi:hypothetical protein
MLLGRTSVFITILLVLTIVPSAHAKCEFNTLGPYPGWEARFNGTVNVGDIVLDEERATQFSQEGVIGVVGMGDMSVEVLNILGGTVMNVNLVKRGFYEDDFFMFATTDDNFDIELEDIRIKLNDINDTAANMTIYTHDQAHMTITDAIITFNIPEFESFLPGEQFRMEPILKNEGELMARNVTLIERFGDFEVLVRVAELQDTLCVNQTIELEYEFKPPKKVLEDTNYSLYWELTYNDYNQQLDKWHKHSKIIEVPILVQPAIVEIDKDAGNRTIFDEGREINVINIIRNIGNRTAFNVQLIDTPPSDIEVIRGQPSLPIGRVKPGEEEPRSYSIISDDPIYCLSASKVLFNDELGNEITEYSDYAVTRFSPFITITKTIFDEEVRQNLSYGGLAKTRPSMRSDYGVLKTRSVQFTADAIMETFEGVPFWSLCYGTFLNATPVLCIGQDGEVEDTEGDTPKVLINRTSEINVEIKNVGNAVARDVFAREILQNIDYSGEVSWRGSLWPGETASYTYIARPIKQRIDITTEVTYPDVTPKSLTGHDIEGYSAGICTKKLENVTFTSNGNYSFTRPDIKIDARPLIRIYEDSSFDWFPVVFNNGTEKVYNVWAEIEFGDLTLTKGQKLTKIGDIDKGGFTPFSEHASCDIGDFHNVNITKKLRLIPGFSPGTTEIVYEIFNGVLRLFVDGVFEPLLGDCDDLFFRFSGQDVPSCIECEDDGIEIQVDIEVFQRFPFHVPPEPFFAPGQVGLEDFTFKIFGNPVGLEFQFWTPSVENETYIPLTTTVTYEDIYRNKYERKFTTDVIIVPSTETFAIIRADRTDLGLVINYTNLTELGEPGQLHMELTSKGYGPIEKYELKINLPNGLEDVKQR